MISKIFKSAVIACLAFGLGNTVYAAQAVNLDELLQQVKQGRIKDAAENQKRIEEFQRDRSRQQQLVQALLAKLTRPASWLQLPTVWRAFDGTVDRDLGLLDLLRLGLALVRVGPEKLDHLVIDSELVTPVTTQAGAAVLAPRWDLIQPKVEALFDH